MRRPPLHALVTALVVIGAPVAACNPPPEDPWTPRRAACGLAPGEVHPYPTASFDSEDTVVYDEECARAIGDDLGIVWGAFPDVSLPGSPRGDVVAKVIAGGWMYLAGDFGTIGELTADPDAPSQFVAELREVQGAIGAGDDDPASRVLYDWVMHHVEISRPWEENVVAFKPDESALLLWDMSADTEPSPFIWVANLAHEVWHHRTDASHVDCHTGERVHGGRDADWNSAYGIELYTVIRLVDHLPPEAAAALEWDVDAAWRSGHFCRGTEMPERYRGPW